MSQSKSSSSLFRPYFTMDEISYLHDLIKEDYARTGTGTAQRIFKKLGTVLYKIQSGLVDPSYVTKVQNSTEQKLGFEISEEEITKKRREERKKNLNWQYEQGNFALTHFSFADIALIQEYRYENDSMAPTEEASYEQNILKGEKEET